MGGKILGVLGAFLLDDRSSYTGVNVCLKAISGAQLTGMSRGLAQSNATVTILVTPPDAFLTIGGVISDMPRDDKQLKYS